MRKLDSGLLLSGKGAFAGPTHDALFFSLPAIFFSIHIARLPVDIYTDRYIIAEGQAGLGLLLNRKATI